jgi:hypothetical protein
MVTYGKPGDRFGPVLLTRATESTAINLSGLKSRLG